ncbi:MAG: tetratricopeptide repeat protein, partial [Fermentimonas sp.]|nr:tetratricopeptide repeat protein [Fermentimonas sp.]
MKKIIFVFTLALITHVSPAQKSVYYSQKDRLFNQGKEMFLEGNYTGAQDILQDYTSGSNDNFLKEEAAYMIAVSSFRLGNENSGDVLKEFLESFPETIHRHQVNFLVASQYYDKKEWQKALLWFNMADLDYLSLDEQEDYSFRLGYTHMQLGNRDEARRYFGLLSQNSRNYRDAADFYLGYIEYANGNYSQALSRFDRLRNHPEYQEEVAFYTAQATFFDGKIDEAIRLSDAFLTRYPISQHNTELNRILGNSYYRLGQPTRAIPYYERYVVGAEKPLRGDAYFMGLSYFETGKYNEALRMFQQAVGESDELSQNAQLQLGQTYLRLNQKQQAQMAFEAASRVNFNPQVRETAMFNYALLAHETNFSVFSESISLFENFLKEFPN